MSGADPLAVLLDRPIAFHRGFVPIAGSVAGAVYLSQALYWQRRCPRESGWWYKTKVSWEDETGLTRYQQDTARKKLEKTEVLEVDRRGMPAKCWYRIDMEALAEALGILSPQLSGSLPTGERGSIEQDGEDPANNSLTTESSAETTPPQPPRRPQAADPSSPNGSGNGSEAPPESSPSENGAGAVERIWSAWAEAMAEHRRRNGQRAGPVKLTRSRRDLIRTRLREYPADDLAEAARGIFRSSFHRGENDRDTEYLGIEVALSVTRNRNNVEKFRDLERGSIARGGDEPRPASWVSL